MAIIIWACPRSPSPRSLPARGRVIRSNSGSPLTPRASGFPLLPLTQSVM